MYGLKSSASAVGFTALCVGSQAALGGATGCAFRFASFPNVSQLPVWTLPAALPWGPEAWTFGGANPVVYLASDGTEEAVDCTADSWRYQTADGEWKTVLGFPADEDDSDSPAPVSFEGFFNVTGDGEITVSGIPSSIAPAMSDSLYGRTIQLNLTCDESQLSAIVDEEDSCVLFQVEFSTYSSALDFNMALYRFSADPALPGIEMPLAQPFSPGDIQLNEGNPIAELDGSSVDWGCNGDEAEYLGEDGEWYHWFTGSDGQAYNLTHVFYATNFDHLNIATVQSVWSPNLEAALYNRSVRLLIHCNNQVNHEEGYVLFKVGDEAFQESCGDQPTLCVSSEVGDDGEGGTNGGSHRQTGLGIKLTSILAITTVALSALMLDVFC
ncbi:unnamed protein product [Hapterophycus canaliculatus]